MSSYVHHSGGNLNGCPMEQYCVSSLCLFIKVFHKFIAEFSSVRLLFAYLSVFLSNFLKQFPIKPSSSFYSKPSSSVISCSNITSNFKLTESYCRSNWAENQLLIILSEIRFNFDLLVDCVWTFDWVSMVELISVIVVSWWLFVCIQFSRHAKFPQIPFDRFWC